MIVKFNNRFEETITYKEVDLVMLRHNTEYGYSNSWWRVVFIDNDNTFIGVLEKCHWLYYKNHKKGEHIRFDADSVQRVYQEGQQFCESDDITICSCIGLCREKY